MVSFNVCGQLTDMIEMVNHPCGRTIHGRRCAGMFQSELTLIWVTCECCDGAGKLGSQSAASVPGMGNEPLEYSQSAVCSAIREEQESVLRETPLAGGMREGVQQPAISLKQALIVLANSSDVAKHAKVN